MIESTTYQPPFTRIMDATISWEGSKKPIATNASTGNYVYCDANGILTDKYGNTGKSAKEMLSCTTDQATKMHYDNFFVKPGIDKLPAEIQPQLFDISINGGPHRATDLLSKVLGHTKYKDQPLADGARAYLHDVGMAQFNNELAEARIAFYDDLAKRKPEKAVNLNGWHRRASGFIMDNSSEDYAKAGFKMVNGKPVLPDQIIGADGKSAVKLPNGQVVDYDHWYFDNVLKPTTNGQATFNERSREAIHYTQQPKQSTDWGNDKNGDYVPPVPVEDWAPEDRSLYSMLYKAITSIFTALLGMFGGGKTADQNAPATNLANNMQDVPNGTTPPSQTLPTTLRVVAEARGRVPANA